MALAINSFEDLVHIIETHPEWRRRLKKSLFDIDLEAALTRLEKAVELMVETQRRHSSDIADLKSDVSVLKSDVSVLKSDVSVLKSDVAELKGNSYERDYRDKANSIFGRYIRRGRSYVDDIADQLYEAADSGQVSDDDITQVLAADMLWGGKLRSDDIDAIVVLEASWRAEVHDVERAKMRADILRKIGLNALPVVAGKVWDEQAKQLANTQGVVVAIDGLVDVKSWENALSLR